MNEIIQQIKAHARQAQIQPQFAKDQAWEIEQLAEALQARANERIEALQADNARLQAQNESLLKAIAAFVNQHRGSTHKGIDELDHLRTITYEAGLFDDQKIFPALQETGQ